MGVKNETAELYIFETLLDTFHLKKKFHECNAYMLIVKL